MKLHPVHGHEDIRRSLARAAREGGVPGATLLHGPPGVGKQRLALWMGQLVLCRQPGPEGPCGECRHCGLALRLEHPDLHWYFPLPRPKGVSGDRLGDALEEARYAALAEIRAAPLRPVGHDEPRGLYLAAAQTLRRQAHRRPSMAPRQVFVVAEAETLVPQESSPEAANALLKLLEEPPGATSFVLTSAEPGRLLPTIRSRTLPLHVPRLPTDAVQAFLVQRAGAESAAATRAAGLSRGSIGRALGFLSEEDGTVGPLEQLRQDAFGLLRAAVGGREAAFSTALGFGVSRARGLLDLLGFLEAWIRDLAAAAAGRPEAIVNVDARDWLVRIVREKGIHPTAAARGLEPLEQARLLASGNVNPQLVMAGLLRELAERFGVAR